MQTTVFIFSVAHCKDATATSWSCLTKSSRRQKPVYMITGLMIARSASAGKIAMAERGTHTQLGVDIIAGASQTVAPSLDIQRTNEYTLQFDQASDFVLTYRLRKIKVKRGGTVKSTKYTKRALYDSDFQGEVDVDTDNQS